MAVDYVFLFLFLPRDIHEVCVGNCLSFSLFFQGIFMRGVEKGLSFLLFLNMIDEEQ